MDMKHSRKGGLTGRQKKQIRLVLLLLPFMIMIGVFSYAPLFGWSYAFVEFTPGVSIFKSQFVGLKYFKKIFENSKDFVTVMRNTLSISFLNICCSVLPAIFAIAISQLKNKRYAKLVQTGTSIPNFISWVLVYSIVFMLLSSEDSALNIILMGLGVIKKPLNVLTNEKHAWATQVAIGVWKSLGYNAIIYLSAITSIDQELYQAAEVDGASYFQRFTKIILPLCKPSIATIILFSFLSHWNGWFDGKIYNNTVVIDKQGSVVASYSKVHLFGLFNEERFFAAGDNFDTYELNGVICGSTICYDLRFPELYRHLSLQGAKIIFVPAEWPSARGDIWTLLSQARGAENHNYIVAVNCVGNFKGAPFYGHSMVVDPMGKIIAEGGSAEEIIYCDIDLAYIDKVRARLNALADVRKELIR